MLQKKFIFKIFKFQDLRCFCIKNAKNMIIRQLNVISLQNKFN